MMVLALGDLSVAVVVRVEFSRRYRARASIRDCSVGTVVMDDMEENISSGLGFGVWNLVGVSNCGRGEGEVK